MKLSKCSLRISRNSYPSVTTETEKQERIETWRKSIEAAKLQLLENQRKFTPEQLKNSIKIRVHSCLAEADPSKPPQNLICRYIVAARRETG